jgi:AcrR family transcriptional regulator
MTRTRSPNEVAFFQEELCDVAERLFAEHGADIVSMRQIAAAMGISPMTPYRYFASRDEILTAVRTRCIRRFAAALENAYADTPGNLATKAMAAGHAYVDFAFASPNTYRLMFGHPLKNDRKAGSLGEEVTRVRRTLSVYGGGLVTRGVAATHEWAMENLIWSTLHGAVMLEMAGTAPPGSARAVSSLLGQLKLHHDHHTSE